LPGRLSSQPTELSRVSGQTLPAQHPFNVTRKGYRIEISRVGRVRDIFSPGSNRPADHVTTKMPSSAMFTGMAGGGVRRIEYFAFLFGETSHGGLVSAKNRRGSILDTGPVVSAIMARSQTKQQTNSKQSVCFQVEVRVANGYLGWPEHAPFEKVIVTAAPDLIPTPLINQLKAGGKMAYIPFGSADATPRLAWNPNSGNNSG
jgi:hypothetical protein